jgi:exopolysaccharide biosynthesis WecB/TagA/CpsF family protein
LNILIVSQYFWPENFRVNDVVKFLLSHKHTVDVLTAEPNYPDGELFKEYKKNKKKFINYYGASVYRVPIYLRRNSSPLNLFLNYLTYAFSSILFGYFLLRKKKYDIVFSFATSPVTSAIPAIFFSKINNCKSFIWILDLWPEILKELKIINNKYVYKFISLFVNGIYNKFDHLLVQSISFQERFLKKEKIQKVIYFPSWSEFEISKNIIKDTSFPTYLKNTFKIVFTGNIGEAQNFEKILDSADILKGNQNISWIIVGSGRNLDKLKQICFDKNINNVFFLGQKEIHYIPYYHSIADVLLISLKKGSAISSTIPGKLQSYLNSNKYILGFISGEAKKIIEEAKVGSVVNPDDPKALAAEIIRLEKNRLTINSKKSLNLGVNYLNKNFNKINILNSLMDLFNETYANYKKIKLVTTLEEDFYKSNFILSGLNLAFLGYLGIDKIDLNKDLYNWPDGIFYKKFFGNDKNVRKISGKNLLLNLKIPEFIKNIYVLGNLTDISKNFLEKKFNKKIKHIKLPFSEIDELYKLCPKNLERYDLLILTLPTPKQEYLASKIRKNNKFFKIICIGGAVTMASGEEQSIPEIMDKLGLEFLWRLRSETYRRTKRLIVTASYFFISYLKYKYYNLRTDIVRKK